MPEFFQTLATGAGVRGVLLGFHLWKLAPELRSMWRAIDRSNRARILGIIASPHTAPELKAEAAIIVREMDEEEDRAKRREIIPP